MKKIACLSAVAACVLAVTAGSAFAGQSTVSGGYAQSDYQGVANKSSGFNLKYRYEWSDSQLGYITSFTHTEKSGFGDEAVYNKAQYNAITGGPAYRINDWASIYGLVGVGHGRFTQTSQHSLVINTAPVTTASPTVLACSSTQPKTLLWMFLTSRAVSVTLT